MPELNLLVNQCNIAAHLDCFLKAKQKSPLGNNYVK